MSTYESVGKTVEEAISEGLSKLNLSIGEVQVDILEEGSKGLFGLFGSKLAKVRLTVKDDVMGQGTGSIFADSLDSYDAKGRIAKALAARQKPAASQEKPQAASEKQTVQKEAAAKPKAERQQRKPRAATPKAQQPKEDHEAAPRPKAPRAPRPARQPREAREPRPVVPAPQLDPATKEGMVQSFLQQLTQLMGVEVSVNVHTDDEGNIRVVMDGDVLGILIGRRGETLDALQYLTGLHLNRGQDSYTRVTLDSEGYRAKREDALIRLANRMANRASRTGRRVSMEPMNPYERRILHSALQNHPGIATHSEGEEPNRHVVITPSKQDAPGVDGADDQG